MKEIKAYLKKDKRSFKEGVKLYNQFAEKFVPDFEKYATFFKKVDKDNEVSAQDILETRLNYVLRMAKQKEELAKKKASVAPKSIKTETDIEENSNENSETDTEENSEENSETEE